MQATSIALAFVAVFSIYSTPAQALLPSSWSRHELSGAELAKMRRQMRLCVKRRAVEPQVPEGRSIQPYESVGPQDQAEWLLNDFMPVKNLSTIEERDLMKAQLSSHPWSAHYWPLADGALGARLYESEFHHHSGWKEKFDFITEHPFFPIFQQKKSQVIENLSVSEKYDLLIGSEEGALTDFMWQQGKQYYDQNGEVESWMGLCHGWAPAAFMVDRPTYPITVTAYDGKTQIKFYPDELKGLSTYQWAQNFFPTRYVGGRCNEKDPDKDGEGRPVQGQCRDNNPTTWHTVVVNKIGIKDTSFIMDTTYDYEVWNQPVHSYEYVYIHPVEGKLKKSWKEAAVKLESYKEDPYHQTRSPLAKYVVGVAMRVQYVAETYPSKQRRDTEADDLLVSVDYMYDLELTEDGTMVGGEWHQNKHPDFLWAPEPLAKAYSQFDAYLNPFSWSGEGPLPARWQQAGQMAVGYQGQVLGSVVYKLIEKAQEPAE